MWAHVEHRHEDLVRSERVLEHQGSTITITTMYEMRFEGHILTMHMMVDEEGRLCFKTRRLPPHLTQANTSKSNVFLSSSAWSTRGVLSFFGSFLAAASGATLAPAFLLGEPGMAAVSRLERRRRGIS